MFFYAYLSFVCLIFFIAIKTTFIYLFTLCAWCSVCVWMYVGVSVCVRAHAASTLSLMRPWD